MPGEQDIALHLLVAAVKSNTCRATLCIICGKQQAADTDTQVLKAPRQIAQSRERSDPGLRDEAAAFLDLPQLNTAKEPEREEGQ